MHRSHRLSNKRARHLCLVVLLLRTASRRPIHELACAGDACSRLSLAGDTLLSALPRLPTSITMSQRFDIGLDPGVPPDVQEALKGVIE